MSSRFPFVGLAVMVLIPLPVSTAEPAVLSVSAEMSLGRLPPRHGWPIVSPDGSRIATTVHSKEALEQQFIDFVAMSRSTTPMRVFSDGAISEEYGGVCCLTFSPDGRHLAYGAALGKERHIGAGNTYLSGAFSSFFVVLDGEKGPEHDGLRALAFSSDGKHLAYTALDGAEWVVVIDGVAGEARYDDADHPMFSPDGKRFAFVASRAGKSFVVCDGKEGAPYEFVDNLTFSPDGRRFAYTALAEGSERLMIVDGEPHAVHDRVSVPVFSPDGQHIAYWAGDGESDVLVVDGVQRAESDRIRINGEWFTQPPIFSSVEGRLGYIRRQRKNSTVVTGSSEAKHDKSFAFGLSFSPDGSRVGYALIRDHRIHVVVDGDERPTAIFAYGKSYLAMWYELLFALAAPRFSPDGRHVAHLRNVDPKCNYRCSLQIVVDGIASEPYDGILDVDWEESGVIRAVVRRDDEYLRVLLGPAGSSSELQRPGVIVPRD